MTQQWWSRSSDDLDPVMMSSDDPDIVKMIQQWWSRSSDDPYPVMMIHIEWWSRFSDDDLDHVMIQIQMKMTWRWRWIEDEDDLKTNMTRTWRWPRWYREEYLCWKLCRENTFLVKRECWCICKFRMFSLVFLMYCNPMFIQGCICNVLESCHARRSYWEVL